ncbi:MAG TPA: Gfo/Idh/MocA family oxidoreductase [Deltaproteobacteria bacterium]|nr:Gfo/Idh/MocA family oxidoreductase [Deltaproteobacteria bacterium]HOI07729.1 Gfo/Idh/MocA family oxidoreductase [Deltaproteobacteria bacterium]
MKIAIIGARRERNGIGGYIAKYFHQNGGQVVCVLGTSEATASRASEALAPYGIKARPYRDFSEMTDREDLDAVAIASPAETHYTYLCASIDLGLSVFCEKPFLDPSRDDMPGDLETLFHLAMRKGTTVAMNSQWPFCLPAYEELCGRLNPREIRRFSIRLSPLSEGAAMIPDSVPHGLSLLHAVLGPGTVHDLDFERGDGSLGVSFTYASAFSECEASMQLVRETRQPRTFSFGFNGRIAERFIDMANYDIFLGFGDRQVPVPDPLQLSVRNFMEARASGLHPVVGSDHIIATSLNLKQIFSSYAQLERTKWKS